jgi:beta-N-acetylhexosaminidase
MTINAGADMLIPPTVLDAEKFHKLEEMLDLAVQLAKDGKIDVRRIDESVRRILILKGKYGLLDRTDFAVTDEQVSAAVKGVGSDENRQTAWDITEQALTLVKNENEAFPVKAEAGQKVLVLFAGSCASRTGTGDFAKQILTEKGLLPEGIDYSVMVNTAENNEECIKASVEADHVIMVHSMYDASNLDPNTETGLSSAVFSRIIDYDKDKFGQQPKKENEYYTEYLKACKKADIDVFLLEYTTDEDVEKKICRYCVKNGFRFYISPHVNLTLPDD